MKQDRCSNCKAKDVDLVAENDFLKHDSELIWLCEKCAEKLKKKEGKNDLKKNK